MSPWNHGTGMVFLGMVSHSLPEGLSIQLISVWPPCLTVCLYLPQSRLANTQHHTKIFIWVMRFELWSLCLLVQQPLATEQCPPAPVRTSGFTDGYCSTSPHGCSILVTPEWRSMPLKRLAHPRTPLCLDATRR